jgi:hypothetical protein
MLTKVNSLFIIQVKCLSHYSGLTIFVFFFLVSHFQIYVISLSIFFLPGYRVFFLKKIICYIITYFLKLPYMYLISKDITMIHV